MAAVLCAGCTTAPAGPSPGATPPAGVPALRVDVVVDGLDHAWDVVQASDGTLLVDERPGGLTAVLPDGTVRAVDADFADLFARGETGLMGLALDPAFDDNRRFYSCQGVTDGADGPEIQVVAWSMAPDWSSATRTDDPLVAGIPVNQGSGRHGGCRLQFDTQGALYIGTGDNALGTNPQDLASLAGKVLRVDPRTGEGLPDNPFADADDDATRRIWTYGHRNVQGLGLRPDGNEIYSVEHGPDRDDEVNHLRAGANYGWDPSADGDGYDESVPMTDPSIPDAVEAVWSSGSPTIAPSGATFVEGSDWGAYDGTLLIGLLKGQGVLALRLDDEGTLVEQFRLPELDGTEGRIRSVRQTRDGALYVTTDNGGGADRLLRITPLRR
ncbi:PQQ-dependent sugar dehydrogenase [Blastococcus jejuensis]|uniref:PQQ-dependent sugar dehydrogenase n=1 Tax=Blastococcus jejuensis TaxID=351224 RepID=A0ABP6NSE5_9ACTN